MVCILLKRSLPFTQSRTSGAHKSPEKEEVTIFAVNRCAGQDIPFEADLNSFEGYRVIEYLAMENDDMKAVNSLTGEKVTPYSKKEYQMEDGIFTTIMKSCSWNVIRLGK